MIDTYDDHTLPIPGTELDTAIAQAMASDAPTPAIPMREQIWNFVRDRGTVTADDVAKEFGRHNTSVLSQLVRKGKLNGVRDMTKRYHPSTFTVACDSYHAPAPAPVKDEPTSISVGALAALPKALHSLTIAELVALRATLNTMFGE